jgi:hypothetical protein
MAARHFSKKTHGKMSCFDTIIGLSNRDCDCFLNGRPISGSPEWHRQVYYFSDLLSDEIELGNPMPEVTDTDFLQVYEDGVLLQEGVGFEVEENKIVLADPQDGAVYQVLYYSASVSPEAWRKSDSGLYLSTELPEEELEGLDGCEKTVWTLMQQAREHGIREFRASMSANMQRRHTMKHKPFSGMVGRATTSADFLQTNKQYCGVRIRTNGLRAGYLKVKAVSAMFERNGTVRVQIFNQHGHVVAPSFEITTHGRATPNTRTNIHLPLLQDGNEEQDYYFVYEYDPANRPRLNKIACASCGDTFAPNLRIGGGFSQRSDKHAWHNYLIVGGWEGDEVTEFEQEESVSAYMNGLSLDIEVGCDLAQGLCASLGNFYGNPWAMPAATAILNKAASWLVQQRLNSSRPNRANAVNKEDLRQQARKWEAEYAEIVQYLSSNITPDASDCLECGARLKTKSIL